MLVSLALIVFGLAFLLIGGETMVRGAVRLAIALNIPPVVVGLTVVTVCMSAPKLAVSVTATQRGNIDIAVGNVIGNNIGNILLILGVATFFRQIAVSSSLIRREIPLMILFSVGVYYFALTGGNGYFPSLFKGDYEGNIARWEGALFLVGLIAYMAWTVHEIFRGKTSNDNLVQAVEKAVASAPEKTSGFANTIINLLWIAIGVCLLLAGSDMLVRGSVQTARMFGVSELMIGLTVLAIGTSLPELIVCLISVVRDRADLAVGNVVGSNVCNLLGVLGAAAVISPNGLHVASKALQFDLPVMILASVFCTVICVTGRKISRKEGVFLLSCYAVYLAMLCVSELR